MKYATKKVVAGATIVLAVGALVFLVHDRFTVLVQTARDAAPGTALPPAANASLQVLHHDGSPAAGLPVWFWSAASRPSWTRPLDREQIDPYWPPRTASVAGQPPPTPTGLRTDDRGRVAAPAGGPFPEAITVEYAPSQWFSTTLPAAGTVFLPALGPVEAAVDGAPADGRWVAGLLGWWVFADSSQAHGPVRLDLATRSGAGVLRVDRGDVELSTQEPFRTLFPSGRRAAIVARGAGFELEPAVEQIEAPVTSRFRFVRPFSRLLVTVVDADGAPTSASGRVSIQEPGSTWTADLAQGRHTFDVRMLPPAKYAIGALMADGEWLRGEVDGTGRAAEARVELRRGTGTAPVTVAMPCRLESDDIVAVVVDDGAGSLREAQRLAIADGFAARRTAFGVHAGALVLNQLPPGWPEGFVVVRNGRVGRFGPGAAGATVAGAWLPSAPPTTIDVAAIYREHGDLPWMTVGLDLELVAASGARRRFGVLTDMRADLGRRREPPAWKGLELATGLRWRLRVGGGRRQPGADSVTLTTREIALPGR